MLCDPSTFFSGVLDAYAPPSSRSKLALALTDMRSASRDLALDRPPNLLPPIDSPGLAFSSASFACLGLVYAALGGVDDLVDAFEGDIRVDASLSDNSLSDTSSAMNASNAGCEGSGWVTAHPARSSARAAPPDSAQNGWARVWSQSNRIAGSFSSRPATRFSSAGVGGWCSPPSNRGGSSFRIISISSVSELDTNGGLPETHSYRTHPSAQRSDA